jgi:hypothetical protein
MVRIASETIETHVFNVAVVIGRRVCVSQDLTRLSRTLFYAKLKGWDSH